MEPAARHEKARLLFQLAERELTATTVSARLIRLDQYRQAVACGFSALTPPVTWETVAAEARLSPLVAELVGKSSDEDEGLEPAALESALAEARATARALLGRLEAAQTAARAADRRWVTRRASLLIAVVLASVVLVRLVSSLPDDKNLAKGKPWRASSSLLTCFPERLMCGSSRTAIFFHTIEEAQPWVEIDLGSPTLFSKVVVLNRHDDTQAVRDRAVPLVLEVGDDQKSWTQLGQLNDSFQKWEPKFKPVTARYVRLRSPRTTMLHLDAVKVYR